MINADYTGSLIPIAIGNKPEHWNIEWVNGYTPPGFDRPALAPESQVPGYASLPASEHPIFLPQGEKVWKVFKGLSPIFFGINQLVIGLVPGARYLFKMPVHLDVYKWSGGKVYPGDGYAAECRAGIGDVWADVAWDDWQNPLTDPNLMPDNRRLAFGDYRDVWTVFTVPENGQARIWVQCKAKYADQSNNFFLYHPTLELVSATGRGLPRVQYERTYVLMPPDATKQEWHDAVDEHFDDRHTIGGSADDGGIGNLDVRRVIIDDPSRWPDDIFAFFETYYPGVEVIAPEINKVILCQKDERWSDKPLAFDCGYTIGQQGCYVTCLAMAQRFYGIDKQATPLTCRDMLGPDGFAACRPLWTAIKSKLGMSVTSAGDLVAHLASDKCAMIEVRPEELEHFVLAVPHDGNFWVYDPIDGAEGWLDEMYDEVETFRLLTPADVVVPTDRTLVTGHIQGNLGAMETYLKTAKPRGVKVIGWGDAITAVGWHPGLEAILLRKWYDNNPPNHYFLDHTNKAQAAKEYVNLVTPGLAELGQELQNRGWHGRLGLESLNEPYCNLCEANAKARDFEIAYCHELMARGIPLVVPAVMNAGVGNPHETEGESILLPLARVIQQYNGFLCLHNYGPVWQGVSHLEDQWQWYTGRMDWWLPVFRANGVEVDLFFSEGGPITGSPPRYQPKEYGGWREPDCYNGDWPQTRAFLVRLNELLQQKYGERCYGCAIFTTGGGDQWRVFEMAKAQWDDLANYV